jgi:hypothetical protein
MSNQNDKIAELRMRRAGLLELQEQKHLRSLYGPGLAAIVATEVGKVVSLDDFVVPIQKPSLLDWPKDLAAAPGLVSAYIGRREAVKLLECFQNRLGSIYGKIGFHDKNYLGLAKLEDVLPVALLRISQAAEDSVIFYVENPRGIIMVDCYPSQLAEPFSVVVQGDDLSCKLALCFREDKKNI